jgi:hypothetical protein
MVEEFAANFLLSPMFQDIHRVVNSSSEDPLCLQQFWVEGKQPLGLGFTESRANNNGSGIVAGLGGAVPSVLVAGVIEKGSSLAEPSMDHHTSLIAPLIAPGDEVVVVGGNGDVRKYFKTHDHHCALDNSFTAAGLASAIDHVVEPVHLQLERPFQVSQSPPYINKFHFSIPQDWVFFFFFFPQNSKIYILQFCDVATLVIIHERN